LSCDIKIVVAIAASFRFKPLILGSSVQAYVTDRRRNMLCRLERSPNQRLIDVAERDVLLHKVIDCVGIVPALMAYFYYARVFDELAYEPLYILAVQRSVFERNRKLD